MRLPVYTAGEGEPVLMIHGIISDGSFFHDAAHLLADEYKVITYDRRGYALDSPADIEDYSIEAQADDAAEIIREYAKEPTWIIGNSAGGLITIHLCLRYPELVKGMILMEPSLAFDEESKQIIRDWNAELNGYREEKKIKKALKAFTRVIGDTGAAKEAVSLADMKRTYHHLSAFMYGELNEIQCYFPEIETILAIDQPKRVLVSDLGRESIFAKTSLSGAKRLEWPIVTIHGFHNALKEENESSAMLIRRLLKEMEHDRKEK